VFGLRSVEEYSSMIDYRVFVQGRMSSSRYPGKMLAPLMGRPLVSHVFGRLLESISRERIILVTSTDPSDDPLVDYVKERLGFVVFRGSLDNLVCRFQAALRKHPAEWFVRICGDSPAIDPELLIWMLTRCTDSMDLLSNVVKRTFPPGQSIEIVRSSKYMSIDSNILTAEEREHATLSLYRNHNDFRIAAVESKNLDLTKQRHVVDTIEELRHMTEILKSTPQVTRGFNKLAYLLEADS